MGASTYRLELTWEQADHLLRLVSIAELTIAEHNRSGWLSRRGSGDEKRMAQYLQTIGTAPSLERPMRALRAWIGEHRAG